MEEVSEKKRRLDLDWEQIMPRSGDDDPPPVLEVTTTTTTTSQPPSAAAMDGEELQDSQRFEFERLGDRELNDDISRIRVNIDKFSEKLPDKGEKLRARLKLLQYERERRQRLRLEKDDDGCEVSAQSKPGVSDDFKQEAPSSLPPSQSSFTSIFQRKLEENSDCRTVNAFDKKFTLSPCDRRKMRQKGQSSTRARHKSSSSSRQSSFQCPSSLSDDKRILSNGNQKGGHSSTRSTLHFGKKLCTLISKKGDVFQVVPPNDSRRKNGKTVVLVDEEEPQLIEMTEQANIADDSMKESKIYYPSRDDPESVEICYSDMECLAPETYLSSTVMNFYIRYLQQSTSPKDRARCDYHIFNTYFYKKLKEAVLNKPSGKETLFVKFRRWWKGVNIFQKAYILLPIHENLHWSLVIICIPDKEDESGPIILHLDSLGLHFSNSIFDNIKRFMIEEWNYLNQGEAPSDLPISERIWKHLPRRIDGKPITVPQQRNDYDCGLFVLFFMERFIEDAPERLKKSDLEMFGKQWFRPEEASGLRRKIRKLLMEEFHNAIKENCVLNPTPLSSVGPAAEMIENLVD
ncbi:ubiquitin-like-specific protease 1D [Cornus florida]|uniref:ubiquitin-like-specific protease 1D n=1 Tax=Cornus florida TaxID=4283 RepID=UPI0028A01742|nr:ubiquitin-like-specific protease 1D [Cornus florida]